MKRRLYAIFDSKWFIPAVIIAGLLTGFFLIPVVAT
jgi:hypothetical protein